MGAAVMTTATTGAVTAVVMGDYDNPDGGRTLLGEAIYRYQYRKQWYLVDSLARWAQTVIQADAAFKGVDLLVPVPTSHSLSDYDPTSLLVDWISQLTTIPRAVEVLRQRQGVIAEYGEACPGVTLGGYDIPYPDLVRGRHVLVIDGIACRGTRLAAAADALRQAGAASVRALVFAKVDEEQ